jgi:hypothetical protein
MRWALLVIPVFLQGMSLGQTSGFLGYPWGTPFDRLEVKYDLREIARSGNHVTYASNVRYLGDAEVAECHLEFVRGRLAGVVLLTHGRENTVQLLAYLQKHFGKGQESSPAKYTWFSRDLYISYDMDSYGDGYVYWYSLDQQRD